LVPSPERIGPANGLIAQIGSVGALTGPPVIGFFIATSGWTALPVMIVIFTLSFVGFAISANAAQR
jgi:nitrate/nitrite transporter NarK